MGMAITRAIRNGNRSDVQLVGAVERSDSPAVTRDVGVVAGVGETGVIVSPALSDAASEGAVLIDFSFHSATAEHAERAAEWRHPMVIGTTGLTEEERKVIDAAAGRTPIVMAPNMSLGVNLLFLLAGHAAGGLRERGYDVEIVEHHHRRKKDAPSGTALRLAEAVAEGYGWPANEVAVYGRRGESPRERPREEIGIHAVRGGDVVGDHTVMFAAEGEVLSLSHRATSRDAFAQGALAAARWVERQGPGLYTMKDVLGL